MTAFSVNNFIIFATTLIICCANIITPDAAASTNVTKHQIVANIEAERQLNDTLQQINNLIDVAEQQLSSPETLVLNAVDHDSNGDQTIEYQEPLKLVTSTELAKQLNIAKNQAIYFQQVIQGEVSSISFNGKSERQLTQPFFHSVLPYSAIAIKYRVKSVTFKDGSQQAISILADKNSDSSLDKDGYQYPGEFQLKTAKPIDKIEIETLYFSYPSYKKVLLTPSQPAVTFNNGESYQLNSINGRSASVTFTLPKNSHYYIEGLTAEGQTMASSGFTAESYTSDQQLQYLKNYREQLLNTQQNLTNYLNNGSLANHLAQLEADFNQSPDSFWSFKAKINFATAPQTIVLYILPNREQATFIREISNEITAPDGLYIAEDTRSHLQGFIDKKGHWVVKPQFAKVESTNIAGIYAINKQKGVDESSDEQDSEYYQLNNKTGALTKQPFNAIVEQINNHLYIVQHQAEQRAGVYDANQQQLVIPMEYANYATTNKFFIGAEIKANSDFVDGYGILTLDGKQILPFNNNYIFTQGDFIYVESVEDQVDVYTAEMKKLNPESYTVVGNDTFSANKPILLQDNQSKQYRFMDKQGQLLTFNLPYDTVQPFKSGLAIVSQQNRYGAIDQAGKLVIPLLYHKLYDFQGQFAAAQLLLIPNLVMLIDRNNQVVKTLGFYQDIDLSTNQKETRYIVSDPKQPNNQLRYDSQGVLLGTYHDGSFIKSMGFAK